MEAWQVTLIVAAISASSGAITTFVNGLIEKRRKKREKDDNTQRILTKLDKVEKDVGDMTSRLDGFEKAQRITMQDRIGWLAEKYCDKGRISFSDYKMIKEMHDIYHHDLHGNGFLDTVMEDVGNLPKYGEKI